MAGPDVGVPRDSRVGVAVVAALAVTLIVIAAASGSLLSAHPVPWHPSLFQSRPSTSAAEHHDQVLAHDSPSPARHVVTASALPTWVSVVVLGAGLLLFALVLIAAVRRLRRADAGALWRRRPASSDEGAESPVDTEGRAALAASVEAASDSLADEPDPRRAVIGCWVRLERAVAEHGTARTPSETALELAQRVLRSYSVEPDSLSVLFEHYRRARYGDGAITEADRTQARQAVTHLRDAIIANDPMASV